MCTGYNNLPIFWTDNVVHTPDCFTQLSPTCTNCTDIVVHTPDCFTQLSLTCTNELPVQEEDYDPTIDEDGAVSVHQVPSLSINSHSGVYTYTSNLLCLESCQPHRPITLPPQCSAITTP